MTIFGPSSLHPKIPFPAALVERQVRAQLKPYSGCAAVIRDPGLALQLLRIESEHLKLPQATDVDGRRVSPEAPQERREAGAHVETFTFLIRPTVYYICKHGHEAS